MLETGELARLIEEDAVVGVTSNPTIFEKALSSGGWYDDQLRDVLGGDTDSKEVFIDLATEDVRRACDILHRVWEDSGGVDGYVSIEVDPDIAYDRDASYEQAMRLPRARRSPQCLREDSREPSRVSAQSRTASRPDARSTSR